MADGRNDAALAGIEAALEGYPNPRFRAGLRRTLERSIRMMTTTTAANLTPYVMVQDIEPVIAFATRVFDAEEVTRAMGSAGGIHCELRIGDSRIMFGGATPKEPVKPRVMGFHVYVPDADATYERAMAAGAKSLGAPSDAPYGERAGYVQDSAGNHWYIATHTGPTYFKEEPRTVTPHLYFQRTPGRGAAEFIAFAQAAFGAELDMRHDDGDRVAHAVLRIRGSALELGEGEGPGFDAPAALVLNVDDLDAVYDRALRAGARSLFAPAAQSFGGRMAGVADAWGNEWFIASA